MREYIYRYFLTLSIYLSNSFSCYFLLDSVIPASYKYIHILNIRVNIFILVISAVYAKAIEILAEKIISGINKQYLLYSLAKFFINSFINGVIIFFLMIIFLFSGLNSDIRLGKPIGQPILNILFFPFLLYTGFFFNFITSSYVFATKEEYIKKNPNINPAIILFTRFMCIPIYLASFIPFILISLNFLNLLN